MRAGILACLSLAACATTTPAPSPAPPAPRPVASTPPPPPAPPAPRYAAVYDDLVARIERDHVFPPRYERDVGHPWRDDVPKLRAEFERATDRQQALAALRHLQNSLRDRHCWLEPPADLPRRRLRLGLRLWTGGTAASPDVRIEEVLDPAVKDGVAPGDAVVSVDGTPIAVWLADHPFESSWLAARPALEESVDQIVRASPPWSPVHDGDMRVLGVRHEGAARDVTLRFHRSFPQDRQPDLDHAPPMASVDCDASSPVDYGDYRLASMGVNMCIYRPVHPGRLRVPIVRYVSFYYVAGGDSAQSLRMVKTDHDLLARELRDADGVVLDLHDNGGGNSPFVFLGWFTAGSWNHERVLTRVVPGLDAAATSELFWGDEDAVKQYADAQKSGRPTIETRFLCPQGHCDGDAGLPSERVTRAPVAVVVGPECVSSCDTFALTWASFHLGRIVGRQPAHAYTVHRLPIHVSGPDSEDLGTMLVAVSQSALEDGASIEGEPLPLDWEAPHTYETRTSWVKDAVRQARVLLGKR